MYNHSISTPYSQQYTPMSLKQILVYHNNKDFVKSNKKIILHTTVSYRVPSCYPVYCKLCLDPHPWGGKANQIPKFTSGQSQIYPGNGLRGGDSPLPGSGVIPLLGLSFL